MQLTFSSQTLIYLLYHLQIDDLINYKPYIYLKLLERSMDIKDFTCGLIAGWAQILTGQPLDMVKIKYQTSTQKLKMLDVTKSIYVQHGVKGYYMGSSSLFVSFGPIIALEFLTYETSKRAILAMKGYESNGKSYAEFTSKLTLADITLAGVFVGIVSALIYCPVEYAKIQKQMRPTMHQSSVGLLASEIWKNGPKNVTQGMKVTIARQTIGTAVYYSSYESAVRLLTDSQREKARGFDFIIAGGFSGFAYWLFAYPFDVVKTKVQNGATYKTAINQFMKQKYRGFSAVAVRSVIVNAMNFFAYEECRKVFDLLSKRSTF